MSALNASVENNLSQKKTTYEINFFNPKKMQWAATKDNLLDIKNFKQVLVLDTNHNLARYRTYSLEQFIKNYNISNLKKAE